LSTPVVAVVDDDHRVLESLESLLEAAGHTVRTFPSAKALLQNGELSQIDCLISDIGMPQMDGFELARLARAARPALPVILISGQPESRLHSSGAERPPHVFFQKPFDERALLAAVARAVAAVRSGRG
jgi:FixJ family two-component response regulator